MRKDGKKRGRVGRDQKRCAAVFTKSCASVIFIQRAAPERDGSVACVDVTEASVDPASSTIVLQRREADGLQHAAVTGSVFYLAVNALALDNKVWPDVVLIC
jgi:hypothetical protein